MNKPIIGIPLGDPAGIGPEITMYTFAEKSLYDICNMFLVGDRYVVEKAIEITGLDLKINVVEKVSDSKFEYGTIIDSEELPEQHNTSD